MGRPSPDRETVCALALAAASAPSMHNAQPWRFRYTVSRSAFHVHADFGRAMPHTDPHNRALHLGCGAALLNARAAAGAAGLPVVTCVLPAPDDDPSLLATVWFDGAAGFVEEDVALLEPVVRLRHTSREPFAERRLSPEVRDALIDAAAREGTFLTFPADWHLQWVLELANEAATLNRSDPERLDDLARWTRIGVAATDTATDGVPEYAFGPRKLGGRAPVRDFSGGVPVADRGAAAFEEYPQVALLSTHGDRPRDWLRAGQAMERVLLVATRLGLASSFVTEVLEWHDTRWPLRDPLSAAGSVQMVLRLGYGPQGPTTPRRAVADLLEIEP
ncbi:hypothetical protein N566_00330 [Streptomycetaceae bacterium MP113-05]|nr:hypothetical protein N566_00330 [Streptomycetaceae bacterium MP113-05]